MNYGNMNYNNMNYGNIVGVHTETIYRASHYVPWGSKIDVIRRLHNQGEVCKEQKLIYVMFK